VARFDPAEVNAIGNVAGNWTGILDTHGLYGRMLGLIGLGEVGSLVAAVARAFSMRNRPHEPRGVRPHAPVRAVRQHQPGAASSIRMLCMKQIECA